ncbi:RHS repeat-associated core domain-containing protein [Clostridium sp. UBA7339]|uniref:RHS repeat-associated core domain-containing protein n=1 Tax=Clostridium sp. UBA7339 TaxID=1946376 RepID=UPI003216BE4E
MFYNYGDNGLVGFTLNGKEYFYIRNAQSDIIGILDSNGTQVVSYIYDTWGKLRSITGDKVLGEKNPYRYRGYRYDTETGYYYLQSRYYNPEWGRFLNADGVVSTGQGMLSHNMFAYCANNPVIFKDPLGLAHCMSNEYGGGGGFGAAAIGGSGALADTVKGAWYGTVGTIGTI